MWLRWIGILGAGVVMKIYRSKIKQDRQGLTIAQISLLLSPESSKEAVIEALKIAMGGVQERHIEILFYEMASDYKIGAWWLRVLWDAAIPDKIFYFSTTNNDVYLKRRLRDRYL